MAPEERSRRELETQVRDLGRRAAVAGAALVALVSLWSDAPVDTACLRGGLVWFARRPKNVDEDDSTGMWETLDEDDEHVETMASTERLRAMARDDDSAIMVVEEGGLLCHAAVIARELGVPAVIGATDALSLIPEGATITVDPSAGTVTLAS